MNEDVMKRAIIVSVAKSSAELNECERSLDELERLLETAGAEAVARVIQIKDSFDPRTVIGSGKGSRFQRVPSCSLGHHELASSCLLPKERL